MGRERIQCEYAGRRDDSRPRQDEQKGMKFHYTSQNDTKLKTYELFISGISHLIVQPSVDLE